MPEQYLPLDLREIPQQEIETALYRALGLIAHNREYLEAHLRRAGADAETLQALADLSVASARLERTLGELMALLECARGEAQPEMGEFDLCRALEDLFAVSRPLCEQMGVALTLDCAGMDCCMVRGSLPYLEEIAVQLLSNALRACGPAGRVQLALRPGSGAVELLVRDNGCGLPDGTLPQKRRLNQHRRFLGGARGGLLLCREYCRQLGWGLELSSNLHGRGVEARVHIPLPLQEEAASPQVLRLCSDDEIERENHRLLLRCRVRQELRMLPGEWMQQNQA